MTKKNIKIIGTISIIGFLFLELLGFDFLDALSYAVSTASVVCLIYDRWLWRINPLEKTPRLRRKYISHQVSTYNGGTNMEVDITIKQTLSSISISETWSTGKCKSVTATLVKDANTDDWKLIYTYLTDPPLTPPGEPLDDMHYGTAILHYESKDRLTGKYFTGRHNPTAGSMIFTRQRTTKKERSKAT